MRRGAIFALSGVNHQAEFHRSPDLGLRGRVKRHPKTEYFRVFTRPYMDTHSNLSSPRRSSVACAPANSRSSLQADRGLAKRTRPSPHSNFESRDLRSRERHISHQTSIGQHDRIDWCGRRYRIERTVRTDFQHRDWPLSAELAMRGLPLRNSASRWCSQSWRYRRPSLSIARTTLAMHYHSITHTPKQRSCAGHVRRRL